MAGDPNVTWIVPDNLTAEQIAEARRALEDVVKAMARAAAKACHELRIEFEMDDPEVARDVMRATFEGLFCSKPPAREHAVLKDRSSGRSAATN